MGFKSCQLHAGRLVGSSLVATISLYRLVD
jgi:hypothetical protein